MTQQEIIREFRSYSTAQQAALMSKLFRAMQESLENSGKKHEDDEIAERIAIVESLYGIAAVEGKPAPTDEEIREDYVNYLMEKYS